MNIIYIVGAGTYDDKSIICAFTTKELAEQFKEQYENNPPMSLAAVAPVWIVDLELFSVIENEWIKS